MDAQAAGHRWFGTMRSCPVGTGRLEDTQQDDGHGTTTRRETAAEPEWIRADGTWADRTVHDGGTLTAATIRVAPLLGRCQSLPAHDAPGLGLRRRGRRLRRAHG